jgi:hypothetical protein
MDKMEINNIMHTDLNKLGKFNQPKISLLPETTRRVNDMGLLDQLNDLNIFTEKKEQILWLVPNQVEEDNAPDGTFHAHLLVAYPIEKGVYMLKYRNVELNDNQKDGDHSTSLIYKKEDQTFSIIKIGTDRLYLKYQQGVIDAARFTNLLMFDLIGNRLQEKIQGSQKDVADATRKWIMEYENKYPMTNTNNISKGSNLIKSIITLFILIIGYMAISSVDSFAAGQYSFAPPNGTFYVGRRFETEVKITTDQATTAADIQIKYDACKLQVEDAFGGVSGVQVSPGTAFPNYPNIGNIVTTSGCNGLIKLTGFTADSDGVLQGGGSGVFAKIRFKVLGIDLTGSIADIVTTGFGPTFTLDSNISDTNGIDMLDSATDGSFILREDINSVPDGDDKPYFNNLSPAASGAGISRDSNIILRANDNESGVDILTFSAQISVNGSPATVYNSSTPELTSYCTTSNLDAVPNCNISINPATSFPYDSQVCVSPTTRDLARKIGSLVDISHTSAPLTYCFRTEYDLNKPFTTNNNPAKNSTGASISSGLTFTLGDNETGVDIASLVVSIDGIDYPYTFTGSPNNYSITVNSLPTLNQNQTYTVRIRAKDKATQIGVSSPNQLDETYTFKTADTGKPFVDIRSPNSNGNLVNLCDSLSFHLKDIGSGVDINSVRVIVSASGEYDKNRLSFTGNPNDYTITISPPTGCWPSNLPLAVGVFAKDNDGNYLDADIWAIANGGTNIIYQTILETIVREVPTTKTVTETQIREIFKTLPSNLSTKEIITLLSDKVGFEVDENLIQKADKNIENRLQAIIGRSQSVALEKVNKQQNSEKNFWSWEHTSLEINGKGTAGDTLWIELIDGNVGVQVTVDKNGEWSTTIPDTLNGLKGYQVTSRPVIDGKVLGNRSNVGKITVIPWWLILLIIMGTLAIIGHLRHRRIINKLQKKYDL